MGRGVGNGGRELPEVLPPAVYRDRAGVVQVRETEARERALKPAAQRLQEQCYEQGELETDHLETDKAKATARGTVDCDDGCGTPRDSEI